MKLAMHVHFEGEGAVVAAVAFDAWDAPEASKTWTTRIAQAPKAVRGEPDLREVPCLLQLLGEQGLKPEVILFDGFVFVDAQETPGPGRHLHDGLGGLVPVIGISKKGRPGLSAQYEVAREEETPPLVITSVGVDLGAAKARVRAMHGRKRVPTLMKLVARLAKNADA